MAYKNLLHSNTVHEKKNHPKTEKHKINQQDCK